jgi:hypothetical protein
VCQYILIKNDDLGGSKSPIQIIIIYFHIFFSDMEDKCLWYLYYYELMEKEQKTVVLTSIQMVKNEAIQLTSYT